MKRFTLMTLVLSLLLIAVPTFAQDSPATLTLWRHETGDDEVNESIAEIDRFNASQSNWEIAWETLPQGGYEESITAAALAGDLPCLFDMDGPTVPNFAWAGHLQPIGDLLDPAVLADVNPNDLGTYNGDIYAAGAFDVALTLFTRRSTLEDNGIRIPTIEEPWTLEEFDAILEQLGAFPEFEYAMDVNAGSADEWWAYAYGPWLQSFGGDLIDRDTFLSAEGILNGPEAIAFGEWFQSLFDRKLVDPMPPDDQGFVQGTTAIHYTGSWSAASYIDQIGDDLLFLPVPDFGNGPKIGSASWQWGVSSNCDHSDGAVAFINFIMQPEEVASFSEVTSLIPTTNAGAALTEDYAEGGQFELFFQYAKEFALVRPPTPGYVVMSGVFEQSFRDIRDGANVQDTLDDAVDAIERDIADNGGYGFE
jgi:multiple sugar transport system substrate-binding protein